MTTSKLTIAVSALVLASIFGCSSSSDGASSSEMHVEKTCSRTKCDARAERDAQACSRCLDACFDASFACDPSRSCKASCSPSRPCSDDERSECVEEGFRVELPAVADSAVEAACLRYFDHLEGCGADTPGKASRCALLAKVERAEAANSYDCLTAAGCGADASECAPPSTTFGEELCQGWGAKCGTSTCTEQEVRMLNELGGWLRADVVAAGKTCIAQESCQDVEACLGAWLTALVPE